MQNCMKKYKNDFTIRFAQLMQENLFDWKNLQAKDQRSLYNLQAIGMYLFIGLLGFLPGKREREYDLSLHCALAVLFFIVAIVINIDIQNKMYQNKIKKTLFPKLLQVFGQDVQYRWGRIPKIDFLHSNLFKKDISYINTDDYFGGTYNDVKFNIEESEIINSKKLNNGKTEETKLFKGIAMSFKMNKKINSRVLIYSKSMFNKPPKAYEKVTLEYEKFNKKYDVWVMKNAGNCSEQIEARYLLNVAFLERFMQLQTSFKVYNIKCSVYGDKLLILLSTRKDVFELNHLLKPIDDIKQYNKLFDEFASVLSFIDVLNLASKTKL